MVTIKSGELIGMSMLVGNVKRFHAEAQREAEEGSFDWINKIDWIRGIILLILFIPSNLFCVSAPLREVGGLVQSFAQSRQGAKEEERKVKLNRLFCALRLCGLRCLQQR
ncbi:MAG: hypothetical protein V3T83_06870 [Acidobacteriota bacterium]